MYFADEPKRLQTQLACGFQEKLLAKTPRNDTFIYFNREIRRRKRYIPPREKTS
jgi:hypothetical protein